MKPHQPPSGGAGPPQLKAPIVRQLGVLLLFNILPVIGGLWLWWNYHTGAISFRPPIGKDLVEICSIVLLCCLLISISCWLIIPLAHWLRRYPSWHFTHVSRVLWAIPMLFGWVASCVIYLVAILTSLICVAVVITGLIHILHVLN